MSEFHQLAFWTKALNLPGFKVVHERRDTPSDPVRFTVQRENLRAIFEDKKITTAAEGQKRFQAWMEQARKLGLKGLDTFCNTLTNWLDKIANYFVTRSSNGRTEGFNHALRSILWRAFGMTNFRHFRLRALHRFGRPVNA